MNDKRPLSFTTGTGKLNDFSGVTCLTYPGATRGAFQTVPAGNVDYRPCESPTSENRLARVGCCRQCPLTRVIGPSAKGIRPGMGDCQPAPAASSR